MTLEQNPHNTKKSIKDTIRKKVAPFLVAGFSAFSGGQALATENSPHDSFHDVSNTVTSVESQAILSAEHFSPENYKLVNDFIPTINKVISDFKYTTEKDVTVLDGQMDRALLEVRTCIFDVHKITDKQVASFCSSKVTELQNLMAEYQASKFENDSKLNDALHVRDTLSQFVDRYNAAYEEYTEKSKN